MIHTLCTNHYLDLIITFIIAINVITMSLEHYNQPHVREPTNTRSLLSLATVVAAALRPGLLRSTIYIPKKCIDLV